MGTAIYQLAGRVNVPENKRNKMNQQVLTILDKCGIRKTREMTVAGENVTVVAPVQPNADGIVCFDYSIFEKKKRDISAYNLNTCELHLETPGYREFGVVMNMIMVLQEAYTDGGCYFVEYGKLCPADAYLLLLQGILGERIMLPGRIRVWEVYRFFKKSEECEAVTVMDLVKDHSGSYGELDIQQLMVVVDIENNRLFVPDNKRISCRNEISSANFLSQVEYAYRVFCSMKEEEKTEMKSFLAKLLKDDFAKRNKWAAHKDAKAVIAELSLYVLPAYLVLAYAKSVGADFWELWDSLEVDGYSDVIKKENQEENQKEAGNDDRRLPFYRAIQRKNEDEFLEFWDGSNLCLSQDMQECIRHWQEQFRSVDVPSDISAEYLLVEMFRRLSNSYCRYVDQSFAAEFTEHGNDLNYRKALLLLKKLLDKGQEYFPELTSKQADQWIIQGTRDRFDCTEISALLSLLVNRKQRTVLFGF